ncbi:DUF2156 domain-containing protein [Pseudonocardiaceae bacterium YIM PH 21723]|nr:DUF2156 domain-containing protein [Pseudonocardiaceae bacterium YIM PH 21723]
MVGAGTVQTITWATRLVGLLAVLSVILPFGRQKLRAPVHNWLDLPREATLAGLLATLTAGVGLWLLASSLRRRKRRAWQLGVALGALILTLHLASGHGPVVTLTTAALLVGLLVNRKHFIALPDPVVSGWRALFVFLRLIGAGVLINVAILAVAHARLIGQPSLLDKLRHALLAVIGVTGPIHFQSEYLADLTAGIGIAFTIGAMLMAGHLALRSAEPTPQLPEEDAARIRDLLAKHGDRDSLGYFALRRDKSVVWSPTGKAAVLYRVLAGTAMVSGDPIGDVEAWPGAIEEFLKLCKRYAWVPAAGACSEQAATVWVRHGMTALEVGDEAVVDVGSFTLDGRPMRGVRQAVNRVKRAGYEVQICRTGELPAAKLALMTELVDKWRDTDAERGCSMALSRFGHPEDRNCLVVTAERDGVLSGILQFVPWGRDGLSLDLMRRDRDNVENGINELMISELLLACKDLGIRQVSLNFAAFRGDIVRGERLGAGPIARAWAAVIRWGSRFIQMESLYRFNAKFRPNWVHRYMLYPSVLDLPRAFLVAFEAEGVGGRPEFLRRLLRG